MFDEMNCSGLNYAEKKRIYSFLFTKNNERVVNFRKLYRKFEELTQVLNTKFKFKQNCALKILNPICVRKIDFNDDLSVYSFTLKI